MAWSPGIYNQKKPAVSLDILKQKMRDILQIAECITSRFHHVSKEENEAGVEPQYEGFLAIAKSIHTHAGPYR